MEEKLQKLPDYTPYYVRDKFKTYLGIKNNPRKSYYVFNNVLSLVNFASETRKITKGQAKELSDILKELK